MVFNYCAPTKPLSSACMITKGRIITVRYLSVHVYDQFAESTVNCLFFMVIFVLSKRSKICAIKISGCFCSKTCDVIFQTIRYCIHFSSGRFLTFALTRFSKNVFLHALRRLSKKYHLVDQFNEFFNKMKLFLSGDVCLCIEKLMRDGWHL